MRWAFGITALLAGVLLDGALSRLNLPGGAPSALLVIVVALGAAYGRQPGAYAGFVAGLASDLVPPGGPVLGREALVLCLIGYLAGAVSRLPSRRTVTMVLIGVASVAYPLLAGTISEILGAQVPWGAVGGLLPTTVAYNVALTPLLGFLVLRISRKLEPRGYRTTRWGSSTPPAWSASRR